MAIRNRKQQSFYAIINGVEGNAVYNNFATFFRNRKGDSIFKEFATEEEAKAFISNKDSIKESSNEKPCVNSNGGIRPFQTSSESKNILTRKFLGVEIKLDNNLDMSDPFGADSKSTAVVTNNTVAKEDSTEQKIINDFYVEDSFTSQFDCNYDYDEEDDEDEVISCSITEEEGKLMLKNFNESKKQTSFLDSYDIEGVHFEINNDGIMKSSMDGQLISHIEENGVLADIYSNSVEITSKDGRKFVIGSDGKISEYSDGKKFMVSDVIAINVRGRVDKLLIDNNISLKLEDLYKVYENENDYRIVTYSFKYLTYCKNGKIMFGIGDGKYVWDPTRYDHIKCPNEEKVRKQILAILRYCKLIA